MRILTLNAGSSSLKAALYGDRADADLTCQADGVGSGGQLLARWADGRRVVRELPGGEAGHASALAAILALIGEDLAGAVPDAVSHRIVHGGPDQAASAVIDAALLAEIERLARFAPLHQPHNVAGIRAAQAVFPGAVQVACFDTAFHRGHPWVSDSYALPAEFYDRGIRRYGFHGLSYEYVAGYLARDHPDLGAGRVVVAHLGNGASMCALSAGRSIASTMGFTALDGLAMGTRAGQIDPGVLLYLMDEAGMDAAGITDLLYRRSGLLGLSGLSADMRVLESSDNPSAARAIDYFVHRIRRELAALAMDLGGLDGLVFTGGIGANSAAIRARVCAGLDWFGIGLDEAANRAGLTDVTGSQSRVRVLAVTTDEESVLAREGRRHLNG